MGLLTKLWKLKESTLLSVWLQITSRDDFLSMSKITCMVVSCLGGVVFQFCRFLFAVYLFNRSIGNICMPC